MAVLDIDALRLRFRVLFLPAGKRRHDFKSNTVQMARDNCVVITLTEGRPHLFQVWQMMTVEAGRLIGQTLVRQHCWPFRIESAALDNAMLRADIERLFDNFPSGRFGPGGVSFDLTDYTLMRMVFSG